MVWMLTGASVAAQPRELPVSVVTVAGGGEVFAAATARWTPAKLRAELGEGDGARTPPAGRLVLRSGNGHAVRLAQLTRVFLSGNEPAADQPLRVRLDGGWLWVAATPGATRVQVEVSAGPVTVGLRGGGAAIRTNPDGSVLVRQHHGAASCSGPGSRRDWASELKPGEELLVPPTGTPGAARPLTREPAEGSWVRWNAEQDATAYGGPPPK
jgi:hypothetical protein